MTEHSSHRSPRSTRAVVPASVWACGRGPIDPADRWPTALLERAVHEFSDPDDRVLLVAWPAPAAEPPLTAAPSDTGAALGVVERLGRHGWTETGWAGPGVSGPVRSAELVVASLLPAVADPVAAADTVAALAMARLSEGGLLVVLARCGHTEDGVLSDPAGSVALAAQAADLLYLQHLIATPVSEATIPSPRLDPSTPSHGAHVVTHTDLFVFLRPRTDAAR
ncbi:hypothetical protein [Nocardia macrotermitis]|uniref:Uncharacterized protein n=1 Tax=Nocardia macrotermitis TaxID=2585198 RepID=A0A7K0DB56_9NOCA|nr:hypothetical protein [Nocardia macrotermitis]MQY23025.1 hypothetical protein [Nocardia macrotermitis]